MTEDGSPNEIDASAERRELLESHRNGTILDVIYGRSLAEPDQNEALLSALAALHNEGLVDIVATFAALKSGSSAPDFFLTRHIFEELLPRLDAPVQPVMQCVLSLYREAGQDMAAGMMIDSFIAFCEKDASRPKTALQEVEANFDAYADLLVAAIVAGSRVESRKYLSEVVRLADDPRIDVRRRTVFAVGRMEWGKDAKPPEGAYTMLEKAVIAESDDEILASIVRSAFSLFQRNKTMEERTSALIENALSKGGELTIHASSQLFGLYTKELSIKLTDRILTHLLRVKPSYKATIDNIDIGLSHMLKQDEFAKAIRLLEDLLGAHPKELSLESFDSAARNIRKNKALLDKVTTRWLLRGERVFCEGVHTVVGPTIGSQIQPEIDASELPSADVTCLLFIARKAIGYLFFSPVSAASLIVSLLHRAADAQTRGALAELLFDPVLINFSGKAKDYVDEQARAEKDQGVKDALESALKSLDSYLGALHSVGDIPELRPSEAQRTAQMRQFSRQMAESLEKAESKSVFLSVITKVVLLYGRKSIGYVYGPEGEARRMEMPLGTHGTEIELPRLEHIDPFGLDYMLRIFRSERMTG